MNLAELKDFCGQLKHVFAPVEQHATHLACVALDTLVGELAKKGVEQVETNAQVAPLGFDTSLIPREYKEMLDTFLAKVTERRSCIDCVMLSSSQLRELLKSAGREHVASLVADGIEYPMSIDLLLQLTKV